jgi:hypothetical protein
MNKGHHHGEEIEMHDGIIFAMKSKKEYGDSRKDAAKSYIE